MQLDKNRSKTVSQTISPPPHVNKEAHREEPVDGLISHSRHCCYCVVDQSLVLENCVAFPFFASSPFLDLKLHGVQLGFNPLVMTNWIHCWWDNHHSTTSPFVSLFLVWWILLRKMSASTRAIVLFRIDGKLNNNLGDQCLQAVDTA